MKTPTSSPGTLGERRHDLDWVRILAFMLLIFYHVGMYYVTWDWHVKSPSASTTIEPLMMLTSPWRLSLLFLISGVATGYLLDRQGVRGFLGRRSVRLLVPLIFGMAVIVPPQSYLEVVEKLDYPGSYLEFLQLYLTGYHGFCKDGDCLILPTWNHLWFVAYLWVYTLLLYAAARVVPGWPQRSRRWAESRLAGPALVLGPIVYLVLIRVLLSGRFPATHALGNDWYNHANYGLIFLLGFVLAGTKAPWVTFERSRWLALGFAVVGWGVLCARLGMFENAHLAMMHTRIFGQAVYGAEQWLPIVAVLGFAHRHLNHDSAARRYLTTAVFPVYILHQTVIVVCAHALQPSRLAPALEGPLLVAVTAAACFLGYEAVRRVGVLRPLFGLSLEPDTARTAIHRKAVPISTVTAPQDIN